MKSKVGDPGFAARCVKGSLDGLAASAGRWIGEDKGLSQMTRKQQVWLPRDLITAPPLASLTWSPPALLLCDRHQPATTEAQ